MGLFFEFIWQFLLEFIVAAPGAFILWGLRGFKGRYLAVLRGDINMSTAIGIGIWLSLLAVTAVLAKSRL